MHFAGIHSFEGEGHTLGCYGNQLIVEYLQKNIQWLSAMDEMMTSPVTNQKYMNFEKN